MIYLQVNRSLLSDRKIIKLANILKVSRPTAVGMAVSLHLWAIDHASYGNLGLDFPEYARDITGYEGDGEDLIEALTHSGWINLDEGESHDTDVDDDPTWVLTDWDKMSGSLVVMQSNNQ